MGLPRDVTALRLLVEVRAPGSDLVLLVWFSVVPSMEDGPLVKTASGARDLQRLRLVCHNPLEGDVLGYLHASAAGSPITLWLSGVVVFFFVAYLCFHDTSSPWFARALSSLCWRMLCRPCFGRSGRCFATMDTLLVISADGP